MFIFKKIKYTTVIWIMFYFIIFSFLLYNSHNYLDADLGWHLAVGERILEERAVPNLDNYDYTLTGKAWVDHEWLLNLATHWLFDNFGYVGVNIFFSLVVVLALIILNIYTQKYFFTGRRLFLIMAFQFFGVLAMAPHLGARMQVITLLNLSVLLLIMRHYDHTKDFRALFWLWPLFCFWANVHAGFLIGIFVLFFWLGIKVIETMIKKIKIFSWVEFFSPLSAKELLVFFIFSLVAVAFTLLNPYGSELYSFLTSYTNDFYLKTIEEWMPSYAMPIQYKQIIYAAIVVAMLIVFFSDLARDIKKKNLKLDSWHLGLTLFFLVLAINSKRHFPLFFVASFSWLIATMGRDVVLSENSSRYFKDNRVLKIFILPIFLLVALNFLFNTRYIQDPFFWFCGDYPCGAVRYIKSNPTLLDKKIFNNYGWGGYLIYVWPEKKLFIDGRLPIYEFAGHTLFEEYFEFFKEGQSAAKLDQYDIDMVLLKIYSDIKLNWFEKNFLGLNEDKINGQKMYLYEYLKNSPDWYLGYSDPISEVYIRL